MGGLDTVIFTGGVGQGSAVVRALGIARVELHGNYARRQAKSRSAP
jgi:acetate kinase